MADDPPYKTEYAKSNRSSCKMCKCNIGKDSLRLAKMVQSPHFDGKVPNWFHYSCFFKKNKPKDINEVSGIESLRWDDQEKIKSCIGGAAELKKEKSSKSSKAVQSRANEDQDLIAEYAKSSRSACKGCNEKIEKGELRLAKMMEPPVDSRAPMMVGLVPRWHHVDCFVQERANLEVNSSITADCFTGFTLLEQKDQNILKKKLGVSKASKVTKGMKRKVEEDEKSQKKQKTAEQEAEEKALKEQSKFLWEIRDKLNANLPLSMLREMLDDNGLSTQGGEAKLLDRCADGIAFGQLLPCPECGDGQLVFRHDCYGCTGNMSEWTKCMYSTHDPQRGNWVISEELKEQSDFLKNLKVKRRKRIFPKAAIEKSSQSSTLTSVPPPDKPLMNQKVAIIGKLQKSKVELTNAIEQLGGSVVEKVSGKVTCCISSPAEVVKRTKKMKDAESADIPVVSEDFLDAVKNGGTALKIPQHSIVPWGKNKGITSVDGPPAKSKKAASRFTSGVHEKKVTLSVKGGAVVDPESGLEDVCHVLEVNGAVYNAILGLVDISRGTNSYYKLQILKQDKGKSCYLFRSWGRVGTSIGGTKLEEAASESATVSRFRELYAEKTGNSWDDRKSFVKYPNRFYPLEIDYGQDDENLKKHAIEPGSRSKLSKPVQSLIKMIFDVESMKKAMVEFEIDLKKMPLGKLTRRQIERAYATLGEAQRLVSDGGSVNGILDASNRFYTLIPHDFGMRKPPLLDNMDLINSKVSMLDNLLEIEVAYSLLKSGGGDGDKDPLDVNYEKLNTKLQVLEHTSPEFEMIKEYVKNTHASTHTQYSLEVQDVFKVERHGEYSRYKPFKELPNRQLLWHGSSNTNYAGILSQGLRIAPPEAPVTGYMFGKGVYFADMASKSANYCRTTPTNNIGLLLLCEVALGNMHELTRASFITKLPKGKHSVKGLGSTHPDPAGTVTLDDGTIVPKGNGVGSQVKNTSLLYNEYIVYDVSQINIKYLLKTEFKYKYKW